MTKALAFDTSLVLRPKCDLKKILLFYFCQLKFKEHLLGTLIMSCCFNLRALRLLKKDTQKDSLTTDLQRIE